MSETNNNKPIADRLFDAQGPLAHALDGYTPRPQQQEMAAAIEEALLAGETILCEAGTGTGKTLAYLVPCLDQDRKIIISTATKTLQDQLFERDIPLVRDALDREAGIALLKGRSNYLCLHRLAIVIPDREFSRDEIRDLTYVRQWAEQTESGDLASATDIADDARILPLVTSTVDNCLGQQCTFYDDCFVVKARREAAAADVVVVNHHLLFADMVLREEGFAELLPSADVVVLDEAHQIPETASKFFGQSLSSYQLLELCRDTDQATREEAPDMPDLRRLTGSLERSVDAAFRAISGFGSRSEWQTIMQNEPCVNVLSEMRDSLLALAAALEIASDRGQRLQQCHDRSLRFISRLVMFLDENDDDAEAPLWIRWFEVSRRSVVLHATPVSIAEAFQSIATAHDAAWVFTSATLSVNGDFSHFMRELGITDAREGCWDSPFDYQNQAMMYLPRIQVEPKDERFTSVVAEIAERLIEAARGRTFLLFTSYRALTECAHRLRDKTEYPLYVQGEAPRAELLRRFEQHGHAVLLGTATFWEGVDVRGPALSCVIIDKLPFAPPGDPVTRARLEALTREGRKPFVEYQIPQAVIALKQGAGRLIRDDSDQGVLVICDPRLQTRAYGKLFTASLPEMPVTDEIEQAAAFLRRL